MSQSIPVANVPSISRNKAKLSQEFITVSDKKDKRVSFNVVIKRKLIDGKEVVAGCIDKYDYSLGNQPMVEETTNKNKFISLLKDKVSAIFDEL